MTEISFIQGQYIKGNKLGCLSNFNLNYIILTLKKWVESCITYTFKNAWLILTS